VKAAGDAIKVNLPAKKITELSFSRIRFYIPRRNCFLRS